MEFRHRNTLFTWQPWLLIALIGYLFAEIYFLTLLVNSLYYVEKFSDFNKLEVIGRVISGAGLGLSVIIGLSLNQRLNSAKTFKRVSMKLATFLAVTIAGYVAMKELYLVMEQHASKSIVHCSILGNAANRVFTKGTLPDYQSFVATGGAKGYGHKQLIRLYLPLHVCLNDHYRKKLQASPTLEVELAVMVAETRLPEKLARPAETIYAGFRDNLDFFVPVVDELQNNNQSDTEFITFKAQKGREFERFLQSQSRFTRYDIQRLSEIYQCTIEKLQPTVSAPAEQRFMLAVSRCLYDVARTRFDSLPEVNKANEIYNLEQNIALHWAQQFIASPDQVPEEALNLMRKSFALVFLPTYAVLVSTFVVFICIAAYVRTRFLIRAQKLKKRVNPILNACLSPLVVVPFIWTAIFLWLPRPNAESLIFPAHTQSSWVKVLQVTQRPLFYYYNLSLTSFSQMNVPLLLTTAGQNEAMQTTTNMEAKLNDFAGFYDLQLCAGECQSIRLHLMAEGSVLLAHYRKMQCTAKLLVDSRVDESWFTFYEAKNRSENCGGNRRWRIKPKGAFLDIEVLENKQVLRAAAQNLFI